MFERVTKYFDKVASDGGPNSSRVINIGVAGILSICMLKLSWLAKEDPGMYYWLCFTTYAAYGMGTHTMNKWIDYLRLKAGGKDAASETEVRPPAGSQ